MKQKFTELYNSAMPEPAFLNVPALNFLMIDGIGDPRGSQEYEDAVNALVAVSFATMFMLKRDKQVKDYGVPPVESTWLLNADSDFDGEGNTQWRWTAMVMQPEHVELEDIIRSIEYLKMTNPLVIYDKIRFECVEEGMTVHMLHHGTYRKQRASVARMDAFASANGCEMLMRHHEIYLTHPFGTDVQKIRTILRHPVIKKFAPPVSE